jgi:hypothetical protein
MGLVDEFPFPFHQPMAQELLRILANQYRSERDAMAVAERSGIDPNRIAQGLSPLNLWHDLLQEGAIAGVTRRLVQAARSDQPNNPRVKFLDALLANTTAPISAEPTNAKAFDDAVQTNEALLFFDDLTMPTGKLTAFIKTLQLVAEHVSSVCLLRVSTVDGVFFGTGCRIGSDLVLTNEHVLVPNGLDAVSVFADFDFDIDDTGAALQTRSLPGDPSTIGANAEDDWAVIRVSGMDDRWRIVDLASSGDPEIGCATYILQHPRAQPKRIGFVRNTVTKVDDRVIQYLTDTQQGSSGAPVFDAAGRIVALHHSGGEPQSVAGKPPVSKNEGIRISCVKSGMAKQGVS